MKSTSDPYKYINLIKKFNVLNIKITKMYTFLQKKKRDSVEIKKYYLEYLGVTVCEPRILNDFIKELKYIKINVL